MSEIIVITSGKGGVGKTTVTANIGLGLAKLNKKVVVVDTDIGLRNLDVVLGLENRIVYNLIDVIEGNCRMKQALIRDKQCDNLYLLPSAQTKDKTAITPEQMIKLTEALADEFDYILLDCPAGIEQGFKNAIAGANRAIVVTTLEVSAIRDADRIIGLLQANEMPQTELIINRLRMDMIKRGEMMSVEDVSEILAVDLLGAIPDDEAVVIATNQGEPLCGKILLPDRLLKIFAAEFPVKRFLLWNLRPGAVCSDVFPVCSKNNKGGHGFDSIFRQTFWSYSQRPIKTAPFFGAAVLYSTNDDHAAQ